MTAEQELIVTLRQLTETLAKPPRTVPIDKQLWDAAACADLLGVSQSHFGQRIAARPDFPAAILLPSPSGKNCQRRWKAQQVLQWVDSRQERKASA